MNQQGICRQILIVTLPKDVDHHNCQEIKREMQENTEKRNIRRVIFDFTNTRFMDSSGIGVLFAQYKWMNACGGDVVVCGNNEQITRVLKISGIFGIVKECAKWEEAVRIKD